MKQLFVTGTDTGVGKTTITCALAAAFCAAGRRVATLKPVETGCEAGPDGLLPADALRLAQAAGEPVPPHRSLAALCPNRFALPVSPEAAALASGASVDFDAITAAIETRARHDLLLVEGAGGLLVPLAPGVLQADLALRYRLPLVIVARAALGTINHTLLTLEAARARGLRVAGVILNRGSLLPGPDDASNASAIARHGAVTILGTFPTILDPSPAALAQQALAHLDLQALWDAI